MWIKFWGEIYEAGIRYSKISFKLKLQAQYVCILHQRCKMFLVTYNESCYVTVPYIEYRYSI